MRFTLLDNKLIPEPLLSTHKRYENKLSSLFPLFHFKHLPIQPLNQTFPFNKKMQSFIAGKQLTLAEIPFSLKTIHHHYEQGYLIYRHGVYVKDKKFICGRCRNQHQQKFASFYCIRCRGRCTYCRECVMMGRVSSCTPLISWIGPTPTRDFAKSPLCWSGTLSEGQRTASECVVRSIQLNEELLVWAVCGAGKTEVLFSGIESALIAGKRVCIATPRTDVVIELTPRLQAAFPTVTIASLYSGSSDFHQNAPITISTTHQLLRFYQAFDAVILDEVDAFPYSVDETLQRAVHQARKKNSSLIYLSATPNQKWQRECRLKKKKFITIPARYHRHSLPIPYFAWCGNWQKQLTKNKLPQNILNWIKTRLKLNKPTLLFCPTINVMEAVRLLLHKFQIKVEAVHAEDPERKEKVQLMRNGDVSMLLTTTILERGVTFPNLDVAILGAEDPIFTESALIQIAGRVGRSADFPEGDIVFFHFGKTEAMVNARKKIIEMNRGGIQRGLIDK
ncbi:DEAD/DEAH box helicase [Bacillus aquiflavi]|uniref:DEAD/DEAH box helicase n=1 Tax=Bacillus aquiflavi TaxID=2672567 RepID=UPI00292E7003|nr:DEAD/DEAH box helicase [Bacillus aquiflavi]